MPAVGEGGQDKGRTCSREKRVRPMRAMKHKRVRVWGEEGRKVNLDDGA